MENNIKYKRQIKYKFIEETKRLFDGILFLLEL